MTDQSPWRTLADRLGVDLLEYGQDGVSVSIAWFGLGKQPSQDLLIGRALRVAKQAAEDANEESTAWWESLGHKVVAVWVATGNSRALAAIELLDAVGWKGGNNA